MEPRYSPEGVEERWQETWEEEGLYAAEADDPRPTFVIAFPPPNVTGDLHMGHALQLALADALVRWRRMQGFNCLFQPGYDHAGIATQSVVEKELEKEGKSRHDLGREAFEARVWEWLRLYGRTIMTQFRRMGASMDYRRERFTMDDGYVRAVLKFFVHLWQRGWLYRDHRIVNWCPFHLSALSDLELDHVEVDDELVYVRYPLADGSGHVTIATVRPATILADVAVAVHPEDERYAGLVGKEVVVPFVERRVPVIADERVEPEFGTGALKVTPGHDPTDFEIGRAHGLPEPMVIGPDGLMNEEAGELAGLDQKEAGKRVLAWCEERGLLERREPYRHTIAVCERCESRIEPLISLQWWCRMDELGAPAIEALQTEPRPLPPRVAAPVRDRLARATRPTGTSRGSSGGGTSCPSGTAPTATSPSPRSEPEACAECGKTELERDPDVLDTWFSSALWPFATLGWPDDTPELQRFYPGDLNITAREIIRLWENRMIFSGLELFEQIPFSDVIIHSTVLAPDGRRMSKSLGTGVDPLEVIDEYGADATRYGLMKMSSQQDTRLSYAAIDEGRRLANKLWNVSRLDPLGHGRGDAGRAAARRGGALDPRASGAARALIEDALPRFAFSEVADSLYHLIFDDFCDWYAEAIKPRLYDGDADAEATALAALERLLQLLHPVMPHVTEEIWTNMPARESRLVVSPVARERRTLRRRRRRAGSECSRRRRAIGAARSASSSRRTRRGCSTPSSSRPGDAGRQRRARGGAAEKGDRARRGHARERALRRQCPEGRRRSRAGEARALPQRARRSGLADALDEVEQELLHSGQEHEIDAVPRRRRDVELLVLRRCRLVEGARSRREVAVVAAGDEESRTLQLLHCRERIRAAEGGRRRELDDAADRRTDYGSSGDHAGAAHGRAREHDLLRAAAAQLGCGRDHVQVWIAVRDAGGRAVAAHVEDERTVTLLCQLPGEGQPLAAVGACRVREHHAGGAAAEHGALEPGSARSLEADVRRPIGGDGRSRPPAWPEPSRRLTRSSDRDARRSTRASSSNHAYRFPYFRS